MENSVISSELAENSVWGRVAALFRKFSVKLIILYQLIIINWYSLHSNYLIMINIISCNILYLHINEVSQKQRLQIGFRFTYDKKRRFLIKRKYSKNIKRQRNVRDICFEIHKRTINNFYYIRGHERFQCLFEYFRKHFC